MLVISSLAHVFPGPQGLARAGRDNRSGDHCSEAPGPWETAGFGCVAIFLNGGENTVSTIFSLQSRVFSGKSWMFLLISCFFSSIRLVDVFFSLSGEGVEQ